MGTSLISNPPYNMKWTLPPFAQMQSRFNDCELPPESNANYAFILTALQLIDDKSVLLLPCGVLTTENKQEKEIRKYLVDKNLIEAVITCPDKMFEATSIPTCIMVFNKHKQTTDVAMVDMRQQYTIEQREQNGQFGGDSHTNRTYVKEIKTFSADDMKKAIKAISEKQEIPEFARTVSQQDVIQNDYVLTPSRYLAFEEKETIHREYADIVADLNRTIAEKNVLKLTVNETIAKSLGLYEFGIMQREASENAKAMNDGLGKLIGFDILADDYISLTKNKNEIRFENNSKDKLSTIFLSILQMYKQHIIYLNNEENRYLIELRDALLPDLMSGKIEV